ncbi:MAG: 2-oxoacid:acceptor oxidoreductase family protein [Thermoplasmatales archaeon]|nr:2-oxoacid:acceptor oxidoreductase family protein [Thermoplasmatales archaeon]
MLKEIIFYGRGGQGAVTAANLLASAALKSGNRGVQSFPFFGAERRGAPVRAFARISDDEILLRSEIKEPDIVVVLDIGIIDAIDVTAGLKKEGIILLNSNREPSNFSFPFKVATVDATSIAIENKILVGGIPVVNTPIVGALIKLIDGVKIEALYEAIKERFPEKISQGNINAAKLAYERVKI